MWLGLTLMRLWEVDEERMREGKEEGDIKKPKKEGKRVRKIL